MKDMQTLFIRPVGRASGLSLVIVKCESHAAWGNWCIHVDVGHSSVIVGMLQ